MRFLTVVLLVFAWSFPAFADVAVDPCEGMNPGDACTTDGGDAGTCTDSGGTLECTVGTATNNATNNASNNASTGGSNNETSGHTHGDEDEHEKKEPGCATVGAASLIPSLLVFGMLVGLRRRR